MTTIAIRILALSLAMVAPPPAYAQEPDPAGIAMLGGTLEDLCRARDGTPTVLCTLYLRGSFEGLMVGQSSMADGETSFCLPEEGVTLAQLRKTFLDFVGGEADRRLDVAGSLLLDSLQDRFPCADDEDDAPFIDYVAHRPATAHSAKRQIASLRSQR